jgi:hypothetical protein
LANTIYDKFFFESLLKQNPEKRKGELEKFYSITDIELIACTFYNLKHGFDKNVFKEERDLLNDILKIRAYKLDRNFTWTEQYKKQLLELNEKIMNGFSAANNEAKRVFENLTKRVNAKDAFLNDFEIEVKLTPFILELDKDDNPTENWEGIYSILCNILPNHLWTDHAGGGSGWTSCLRYENDGISCGAEIFHGHFDDHYICYGMYELRDCSRHILSWYDILKINEIWIEVKACHQHFIENIGKGKFWDDSMQSLSDNEAENLRQEYMGRLSKDMTGLPVEIFVDEMNAWENTGPFKRIKFQGNTNDKIDFKKMYSMSIDEKPHILVKNAEIDLTADELKQVKDFVSKNKKCLLQMAKGNMGILDFAKKIKVEK